MNAEIFAEWLRRQGYQVARTQSTYWVNLGKRVWQAFPYHWLISPEESEINEFLRSQGAIGLRYSTPFQDVNGCPSYHIVYEKPFYHMEDLGKKARYDVRQGMKNSDIKIIPFKQLAESGWQLQVNTFSRQGRKPPIIESYWRQMCQAAKDLPGFEAWGVLNGVHLAAAALTVHLNDCFYILHQMSHRDFLHLKVNNALAYALSTEALKRTSVKWICYGLHSLDAPPSVDEFKFRMGYIPKPVRQRVVFHPLVEPLVNKASHKLLQRLLRRRPGHPTLSKAEGMFRFYLEGRKPLEEQAWPECLENRKEEILNKL